MATMQVVMGGGEAGRLLQVRISAEAHRLLRLEAARLDQPLGRVLSDLILRCLTPEPPDGKAA